MIKLVKYLSINFSRKRNSHSMLTTTGSEFLYFLLKLVFFDFSSGSTILFRRFEYFFVINWVGNDATCKYTILPVNDVDNDEVQ